MQSRITAPIFKVLSPVGNMLLEMASIFTASSTSGSSSQTTLPQSTTKRNRSGISKRIRTGLPPEKSRVLTGSWTGSPKLTSWPNTSLVTLSIKLLTAVKASA
ncbi:hypothetical protein [Amycolatopsis thailandensis]|uniref:hypothetical protein n=1 Tax=Amycolatopsis thailandensis TaxID=589330 RepID=UPI003642D390